MEEYLSAKFIYHILFLDKIDHDNLGWLTDINVLLNIKKVLETLAKNNYISGKLKDRVYDIVMLSREIRDGNYNERVEILNSIIGILNNQIHDESYIFYINEYCKRNCIKSKKYLVYNIEEEVDELDKSIAYDYIILKTFSSSIPDSEFNEYLEDLKENPTYFYEALNTYLEEFPEVFKDKTFKDRMNTLMELIYKNNKCLRLKKLNKLFYKEIDKKCNV